MFKVIIVDRNGRKAIHTPRTKPVIEDGCIKVYDTKYYTLVYVIANLTSYSITDLSRKFGSEDKGNEE